MSKMAQEMENVVANITAYVRDTKERDSKIMDIEQPESAVLEGQLDSLIEELQARLESQRQELAKVNTAPLYQSLSTNKSQLQTDNNTLSSITTPSPDPSTRITQLRIITRAYKTLRSSPPHLPEPGSLLPTLLAARDLEQSLTGSLRSTDYILSRLDSAASQTRFEEANLADALTLASALSTRLADLERAETEHSARPPEDRARRALQNKKKRTQAFDSEAQRLRATLDAFVADHLAAMIAAEELGGPVVGELADVDDDMLTAGFSAQGKPRSSQVGSSAGSTTADGKRQRRIDEIWGAASGEGTQQQQHDSELSAAREEITGLLDELLAASRGESEEGGDYVRLKRDSAAARFLVRAKVAQFHARDARRLRLVDFGREVEE